MNVPNADWPIVKTRHCKKREGHVRKSGKAQGGGQVTSIWNIKIRQNGTRAITNRERNQTHDSPSAQQKVAVVVVVVVDNKKEMVPLTTWAVFPSYTCQVHSNSNTTPHGQFSPFFLYSVLYIVLLVVPHPLHRHSIVSSSWIHLSNAMTWMPRGARSLRPTRTPILRTGIN